LSDSEARATNSPDNVSKDLGTTIKDEGQMSSEQKSRPSNFCDLGDDRHIYVPKRPLTLPRK
jgi:hypothetical protein